jgi:hypothetical protein
MLGKNHAALSFATVLSFVSPGVVAAETVAVFFGTSFLLLTHPWEEIATTSSKPAAATAATSPLSADTAAAATAVTYSTHLLLWRATCCAACRSAEASTIRARSTCLRGRLRSATIAANCSRSAALK